MLLEERRLRGTGYREQLEAGDQSREYRVQGRGRGAQTLGVKPEA